MTQIAIGESFESTIQIMREYVSEIQDAVYKVFEDFHQVSVLEHPWELLYKTAVNLEKSYNEQVLETIKTEINNWAEGEGSYVNLTVRFKMGEEAKKEAERQQNLIIEEISSIPEITLISESNPDFLNTRFELELIKQRLEEISTYSQKLTEIVDEKNNALTSLSEENGSVSTIVNVGITYGVSISNFVTKVTDKISIFLSEQLDSIEQQNEFAVEEAKQSAKKFNQSIDETLTSMNGFLEDLFG